MRRPLMNCLIVLAAVLLAATPFDAQAAATIVIQNNDGAGEGFNDPTPFTPVGGNNAVTLGQARLIAFTYAANLWGGCLNSNVTITIRAQMDPQTCTPTSATLGSAGATTVHRDFTNAPAANTWFSQALANSLNGADLDGGQPDVNATFNSSINGNPACLGGGSWYYGLDGNPGPNQWDFVTVVLHEIGHGVGFQTFIDDNTGARFMDRNDQYMRFMEQAGATPSMYTAMNDAQRAAGNISDPNLRWTGGSANAEHPNVPITAGLNGGLLRLHGPNPTQPGSSLSHWSTALSPSELMEPSYTAPDHNMSLALYLLEDIGWSIDDSPPTITCPSDVDVECTTASGTPRSNPAIQAWLASVTTSGGCGEVVVTNDAPSFFPDGTTTVTFTARDGAINTVTCTADVNVVDTTPPVIVCPTDVTVECSSHCGVANDDPQLAAFFAGVSATDICDPSPVITHDAPACFPEGETTVTFTATDDDLNFITCTAKVTVEDTTPPEIDVVLSRDVLWPPNHKLAEVCAEVTVTDVCDPNPTFVLTSIESDEPDNGQGDGNFPNDIQDAEYGTPDLCFDLRSERQGGEDGRKYTIIYCASDEANNTACDTVCVRVPHDQGAGALSSTGFIVDGRGFVSGSDQFAVIIPAIDGIDAGALETSRVYLGNTGGVAQPQEIRIVEVNSDGRPDLALFFSTQRALEILGAQDGESNAPMVSPNKKGGNHGTLGVHFVLATGADYLVADVLSLGAPVAMPERWFQNPPVPLDQPEVVTVNTTGLKAIHPNPFNPQTTVTFSLVSSGLVRIAIYDVRGKLVRRLADTVMPAGDHSVAWNGVDDGGRTASSGVYFVRMIAGSYTETRKIVMLK
ncbi:MAG TPA: HYR domain-containing protein [Candidatus Krumholzibacteria bacterium]|nr:HYR domain-containing protein [Candidatus Krumholzibacteria bacterium]